MLSSHRSSPLERHFSKWLSPVEGADKLNVDGATNSQDGIRGIGAVVRDFLGLLNGVIAMRAPSLISVLAKELYAIRAGIQFAVDPSFLPLVVKTDSL